MRFDRVSLACLALAFGFASAPALATPMTQQSLDCAYKLADWTQKKVDRLSQKLPQLKPLNPQSQMPAAIFARAWDQKCGNCADGERSTHLITPTGVYEVFYSREVFEARNLKRSFYIPLKIASPDFGVLYVEFIDWEKHRMVGAPSWGAEVIWPYTNQATGSIWGPIETANYHPSRVVKLSPEEANQVVKGRLAAASKRVYDNTKSTIESELRVKDDQYSRLVKWISVTLPKEIQGAVDQVKSLREELPALQGKIAELRGSVEKATGEARIAIELRLAELEAKRIGDIAQIEKLERSMRDTAGEIRQHVPTVDEARGAVIDLRDRATAQVNDLRTALQGSCFGLE